jgi:hypothetical protein
LWNKHSLLIFRLISKVGNFKFSNMLVTEPGSLYSNRTTRQYQPRKFRNVQTCRSTYKYSFFPQGPSRTGIIYHQNCWIWMI